MHSTRKKLNTNYIIYKNKNSQRIDNFLIKKIKKFPKSLIYKLIRKKKILVNYKKTLPKYKLKNKDVLKFKFKLNIRKKNIFIRNLKTKKRNIEKKIIYEDNYIIAINKPSGLAVHGGSGVNLGLIELLRKIYSKNKFLELIHRLDRDTSGVILIAKKKNILCELQNQLKKKKIKKEYIALVKGNIKKKIIVKNKIITTFNKLRKAKISKKGKESKTILEIIESFKIATLLKIKPITGRTHQIRIHSSFIGHPIALDYKYGDVIFNKKMKEIGLNRFFLHSKKIKFFHPFKKKKITIIAKVEKNLKKVINILRKKNKI
ncbi:MAG: RluA family pseudouridine synthase [Enterobacteriaceae bacterium]